MSFFGNDSISFQASSPASGALPTILDWSAGISRYKNGSATQVNGEHRITYCTKSRKGANIAAAE
jgi:hypothetical protein